MSKLAIQPDSLYRAAAISDNSINKFDIVKSLFKIGILSVGTFFMVRWLFSQLDPTRSQKKQATKKAKELLEKIGIHNKGNLSEHELMIASHLVIPNEIPIDWTQIAGLDEVIEELRANVILPLLIKKRFPDSHLTQAPKGVLLHGPPGCGKTMIAKATAREAHARFINLDVSLLTDKWYGESQKLARAVFSLAVKLQPCIVFIDEIDSFLRRRNSQDHEATAMMKAQFMSLWDGLITDPNCTVIVMGATNRPSDLDNAIFRRLSTRFYIPLPNVSQRRAILELILNDEVRQNIDVNKLARDSEGFSGSDLRELCRNASIYRIREYLPLVSDLINNPEAVPSLREITMADLETSLRKVKESKVHGETLTIE